MARSSKPTNEPEKTSRSRSKPTDPYPQSTQKPEKKKKKKPQPTDRSVINTSGLSKIDASQHRHLLAIAAAMRSILDMIGAQPKMEQNPRDSRQPQAQAQAVKKDIKYTSAAAVVAIGRS